MISAISILDMSRISRAPALVHHMQALDGEIDMVPVDQYLKFGSMGFAALILATTVTLVQKELNRSKVDKARLSIIAYFMGFAFLLLLVSASLEIWQDVNNDNLAVQKEKDAETIKVLNAQLTATNGLNNQIVNESVAGLEQLTYDKALLVAENVHDPESRLILFSSFERECGLLQKISSTLGGPVLDCGWISHDQQQTPEQ